MFTSLLFLLIPYRISADCFIEQESPGKRESLKVSYAVDDFHCKILCFLNPVCVAFTFNDKLKGCPTLDVPSPGDGEYIQHPSINGNYMLPIMSNTYNGNTSSIPCGVGYRAIDLLMPDNSHRIVASYYAVNVTWDAALGAWNYKDFQSPSIYIRAAACFSVPLADAHALDAGACQPLANLRTDGYGPPSAPFNRSVPCANKKATRVSYMSAGGNVREMEKKGFINCIYGTWLHLEIYAVEQTRGIVSATCM